MRIFGDDGKTQCLKIKVSDLEKEIGNLNDEILANSKEIKRLEDTIDYIRKEAKPYITFEYQRDYIDFLTLKYTLQTNETIDTWKNRFKRSELYISILESRLEPRDVSCCKDTLDKLLEIKCNEKAKE